MRRPQQRAEPSIYKAVDDLVTRGHRQGASLANDFVKVPDLLERVRACHGPADSSSSQATAQDDEQRRLWANLVTVHAWLLRDLLHACHRHAAVPASAHAQAERVNKLRSLADAADDVLDALREQLERPGAIGARIGFALVRSDLFRCYSQLLVAWPSGFPVEPVLISAAKACGSCTRAAVLDAGGTGLFTEWVAALADSQLLEHAARVLARLEEEATDSPHAGMAVSYTNDMMNKAFASLGLPLQFSEVRCLLSGRPGAYTAFEAAFVAALPAVRSVLSGPCLQYWLGRTLLVAELRAAGTARCHGLPDPSRLVAAPWAMFMALDREQYLRAQLWVASTAWHITASIPVDLPEALGAAAAAEAAGDQGSDDGAVVAAALAGAVARRRQPSPWRVAGDGMPYSAAHVYDLTHGALSATLREGTGPASIQLLPSTVLLVRLALERLRPAAAAARLPGLWRVVLSFLRSFDAAEVALPGHGVHPNLYTLVSHLGRLLRLDLREGPPPSGQARGQAEGGAQAEAAGAQLCLSTRLAPTPHNLESRWSAGGGLERRTFCSAAAPAPAPGCSFSLRCALEAGFLPAVEQLLRRLAGLPDLEGAELFLYAVNCLPRGSGVWPAVLAHGSVREVASLILTLRKATWATSGVYVDRIRAAEDEDLGVNLPHPQAEVYLQGPRLSSVYVAALLEQMLTVLRPQQNLHAVGEPEAGSTCSGCADSRGVDSGTACSGGARNGNVGSSAADSGNTASSGAGGGGADSGGTSSRGAGSEGAGSGAGVDYSAARSGGLSGGGGTGVGADSHLALNYALGAGRFAGHGWLARAGGRPTHGSPAAEQQRMLASFALAQWLPVVDALWLPMVQDIRSACLATVARQCLGARLRVLQAAAAPGSAADGVEHQEWLGLFLANYDNIDELLAQLRSALSNPPGPGAAEACYTLLQHVMHVVAVVPVDRALQIAIQITGCCVGEAGDGTAPCSQSPRGTELAVRAWAAAAAAAAAAADPPVGVAAGAAAAAEQPAGAGDSAADACAVASTNTTGPPPSAGDPISRARWLRLLLLRAGCGRLAEVLDAALPLLALEAGASGEEATEAGRGLAEAGGDATGASGITGGTRGMATGRLPNGGTDNGVRGDTASADRSALRALLDKLAFELLEANGSSEVFELPPPSAALRAAKAAGVVPCANPGCANLEGPSEAALSCRKTCSRCRAVSYCSGSCQLAHWQAGHREGCAAGLAAPLGSGSRG